MDFKSSALLESYFSSQLGIFKVEDLCKYLRGKGVRITKTQALDLLNNSSMVFALVDDMYITRAGVFTGRYFSFKPTKEEVQKGYVILGHRCMPFINPDTPPDRIVLVSSGDVVLPEPVTFSMNLAMDVFALYGEGYIIPYILNDNANESVSIASLKYLNVLCSSLPIRSLRSLRSLRFLNNP